MSLPRLSKKLALQGRGLELPAFEREKIGPGILHLGIGAFHRAHQAVYTDQALGLHGGDWKIVAASLRHDDVLHSLAPQDFLYSVGTLLDDSSQSPVSVRVIGCIDDVLAIPVAGHRERLVKLIANPAIKVITLTITEKGYLYDPVSGSIDENHKEVVSDRENINQPVTAPGILALGLQRRRKAGAGPLGILSCDNLAGNGHVTRAVVKAMAAQHDAGLSDWIERNISFPGSMVDRIVPQMNERYYELLASATGYEDMGSVVCEPFSQWVIEDQFAAGRPRWDDAGASFVSDAGPYEHAKLNLLNAAHSAAAYSGILAGYQTIHETVADPGILAFLNYLMKSEIKPVVSCPAGMDLDDYQAIILERFANQAVRYRNAQVATDGSKKLPERILPVVQRRLDLALPVDGLCLVIAAWLAYLHGSDFAGQTIEVNEPMLLELQAAGALSGESARIVDALLDRTAFAGPLAHNQSFRATLYRAVDALSRRDLRGLLDHLVRTGKLPA